MKDKQNMKSMIEKVFGIDYSFDGLGNVVCYSKSNRRLCDSNVLVVGDSGGIIDGFLTHDIALNKSIVVIDREWCWSRLLNDPNDEVVAVVAQQGYFSKELAKDPSPVVRAGVARSGNELGVLVHDENFMVRWEVYKHGFGLENLDNDPDSEKMKIFLGTS